MVGNFVTGLLYSRCYKEVGLKYDASMAASISKLQHYNCWISILGPSPILNLKKYFICTPTILDELYALYKQRKLSPREDLIIELNVKL